VEASHPTAAHSSTTALGRSHVGKEGGRDQRCRTEKTKLIHGRLLDSRFADASLEITLSVDGEPGMNIEDRAIIVGGLTPLLTDRLPDPEPIISILAPGTWRRSLSSSSPASHARAGSIIITGLRAAPSWQAWQPR
jgi:hypothetical protein